MKTIQLIIEAAILLSLIVVCVLLAGKRTVKVDGDVRLTHSQVSDIVDGIEETGSSEASGSQIVKIDPAQMQHLISASGDVDIKWEFQVAEFKDLPKFGEKRWSIATAQRGAKGNLLYIMQRPMK